MAKQAKNEHVPTKNIAENGSNNLARIQKAVKAENCETFTLTDETTHGVLKALAEAMEIRILFHTVAQNNWCELNYNSLHYSANFIIQMNL